MPFLPKLSIFLGPLRGAQVAGQMMPPSKNCVTSLSYDLSRTTSKKFKVRSLFMLKVTVVRSLFCIYTPRAFTLPNYWNSCLVPTEKCLQSPFRGIKHKPSLKRAGTKTISARTKTIKTIITPRILKTLFSKHEFALVCKEFKRS